MSSKRIVTIVNIVLTIIIIVGIFLPFISLTNKSLFSWDGNVAKYFIFATCLIPIVTNAINKKVEYGLIFSGFVFLYLLQLGCESFNIMSFGYYIMLIASFAQLALTIVYGFLSDDKVEKKKDNKANVRSQFKENNKVMNGYPNGRTPENAQMPYPNQMMYRNGQPYNNGNNNKR
jgi:hypothetical protein